MRELKRFTKQESVTRPSSVVDKWILQENFHDISHLHYHSAAYSFALRFIIQITHLPEFQNYIQEPIQDDWVIRAINGEKMEGIVTIGRFIKLLLHSISIYEAIITLQQKNSVDTNQWILEMTAILVCSCVKHINFVFPIF
jgi:hypothetical protein